MGDELLNPELTETARAADDAAGAAAEATAPAVDIAAAPASPAEAPAPAIDATEQLLRDVEKAAHKGAAAGRRRSRFRFPWVRLVLVLLVVAALLGVFFGVKAWVSGDHLGEGVFDTEPSVGDMDLTVTDHGIFGYKAADFSDVILGDTTLLRRLEVYSIRVSDVCTLEQTGLANLSIFSKVQYLTFHGTAIYTVDLRQLNEYCFVVDNDAHKVTVYIPHSSMTTLTIPASEIEFSDIERGWLAFGDIKITPEQQAAIEAEAQRKMEQKLLDDQVSQDADRFAKLTVWELFQPVVSSVAPGWTLEVEFLG